MVAESSQNKETQWLLSEKYGGVLCDSFERDCERLRSGEPLGYTIGFVPFLGCKIWLDSHPLIPRPETEFWVERAIADIQRSKYSLARSNLDIEDAGETLRVLDLCAGSGCIGIAVARALRDARGDFAEIDPRHHLTILKNLAENHIPLERTKIFGGDLFEKIQGHYDLILANPPYIDPALASRTETGVLEHEPHLALFGGIGGMELIEKIIAGAPHHLAPNGTLCIEHEPEQMEQIHALATKNGYTEIETLPDQYGIPRTTRMRYDR